MAVFAFSLSAAQAQAQDKLTSKQLYSQFQNPDSRYRPFVRWWWNGDRVNEKELVRELRIMKEAGIGGVEINPIEFPAGDDTLDTKPLKWLSDEWIDMLKVVFDEADKLGMRCDLIIGSGWPFGAESLPRDERAEVLLTYAKEVPAGEPLEISMFHLFKELDPGVTIVNPRRTPELVSICLAPDPIGSLEEAIDLSGNIKDGVLTVDVPEGKWQLYAMVKFDSFASVINGAPGAAGSILNHMDAAAVRHYLDHMADAIEKRIGPLSGRVRAMFIDSMELEGANWTSDMDEEFKKRYGYDITEWLPFILFKIGSMGSALNYDPVVPVTDEIQQEIQRARYDFEEFKAQLMQERFTATYLEWCHQLGVKARAQAYGRGFYPLENAMGYDIPEGESWTTNWLKHKPGEEMSETDYRRGRAYTMVNKFVSSAAHLAGNRTISCEEMTNTYTVFNMSLEQLKIGGDQSAMSGVTHSVFHGFNYSPNLEAKFPGWVRYGAYYSENNNWWPFFKYYNDYKARLSYALQHGTYYADIAILNPENDMWSTIGMQNEPFPNTTRAPYKTLIWEAINKCGGGVDYVSENIINQSNIKRGNLCFNKRKYNTLMLIDVESLHPETAHRLLEFVESGGKIVCIDTIPYQSLGRPNNHQKYDSLVKATMDKVMEHKEQFVFVEPPKEGFIPWYDSLLHVQKLPHYLEIENPDPFAMQNRYTTDDGSELILMCNSHRYHAHQTKITFSKTLTHKRQAQVWDLQTGKRYALPLEKDGSYTVDLGPVESVLMVFEKSKPIDLPVWQPLHTFIETIPATDISDNWDVTLCHSLLYDTTNAHFDTLFDLKDNETYQHFCGTIAYHKTINCDRDDAHSVSTILNLGLVEGVSEVFVNGQSAGVQYFGRRIYDITHYLQEGENDLEVRVTTTMGNYLKTFSREENPTAWIYVNHPRRDQPLQPQGLLGPVKLYHNPAP